MRVVFNDTSYSKENTVDLPEYQRRLALILFLLTAPAWPTPAGAVPDPVTFTSYADSASIMYQAGFESPCDNEGDPGLLYFPSDNGEEWAPGTHPLVVLAHGTGYDYQTYQYLQDHLARNGFAVASIADTSKILEHIQALYCQFGSQLKPRLGLIGHSSGGERAVEAASDLFFFPMPGLRVVAVASLAPTDGNRVRLTGAMADAFLAIYSSYDNDVFGLHHAVDGVRKTAFGIFDRSGTELPSEGTSLVIPHRAMVFIHGGGHSQFSTDTPFCVGAPTPTVTSGTVRDFTKGYVNAMFRWQFFGESEFNEYFRDQLTPPALLDDVYVKDDLYGQGAGERVRSFLQYHSPAKRVVANFEENTLTATIGGDVTVDEGPNNVLLVDHGDLIDLDPSHSAHDTRGIEISWDKNGQGMGNLPSIRIDIPDETVVPDTELFGYKRDVSQFVQLSFRAGQRYLDPSNTEAMDQDFRVTLTAGNQSESVLVSDWGALPYPDRFQDFFAASLGCMFRPEDETKSVMNTIRIPLSYFADAGLDLTDVREIELEFGISGHRSGTIHLDSIEFVK